MRLKLITRPWITDIERKMMADALTEESWYEKRCDYIERFEKESAYCEAIRQILKNKKI